MGHDSDTDIIEGIVLDEDRPLTEREKQQIAKGYEKPSELLPNGGKRIPFDQLPVETLRQYQAKAIETRRRNTAAKKLMEQAAYLEAHKEHAATILGGRLAIIEGLLTEMVDPKTQKPDTRLLDEKRLKVLQTALNDFDKGMGMTGSASKDTQTLDVNVTHTVAQIVKSLGGGS